MPYQSLTQQETKALRLCTMIRWFEHGGRGTVTEIAGQLGQSRRTVQRDMAVVRHILPLRRCGTTYSLRVN